MTIRYLFLLFKFFWDIIFCSTATIQINALHNDDDSGVAFYGHPKRTCKQAQQIVNFFYHNVVRFSYVHKTFGLCCKFYQVISTRIILEENKEIILVQNRAGSEGRNESAKITFFPEHRNNVVWSHRMATGPRSGLASLQGRHLI